MSLTPGTRLGVYEITAQIGEGGMGQVYRATDTALGRPVAIKILPDAFAADPERLARFEREAKTLASLNHPNIAAIYAIETSTRPAGSGQAGTHALVMELVEGEDLSQRIARGAIPVDEALPIAKQIAEALEAAHELGIVHRDLKPANAKLRPDGVVKVLDFGLAKAMEPGSGIGDRAFVHASQAPTITTPALMTGAGMILGTAAYMAPEQARGKTVDKRADIWAFGAVLFEMLTGTRAFEGEDIAETIGAVIHKEPVWSRLPTATPASVRAVLHRCLQKDPRQRVRDIGDVRLALEGAFDTAASAAPAVALAPTPPLWRRLAPITAGVTISALLAGTGVWWTTRPAAPSVVRTTITTSGPTALAQTARDVAVTPDGARIVYRGDNQLFVRALDRLEPAALSGPGVTRLPFISPDGQWVGFFDANTLKKVAITGGPPVTVTATDGEAFGATWDDQGTIVYATGNRETGLQRVSAAGGMPTALTSPAAGELDHVWPEFLPGGQAVLFTIRAAEGLDVETQIAVLDLRTGMSKALIRGGSHGHYVPTGHLVYGVDGSLFAVAFDLGRLEVVGTPVPVLEGVDTGMPAQFAVAANGSLVYIPGVLGGFRQQAVVVDRQGRGSPLPGLPPDAYRDVRVSPDGTRLALATGADVWIYDLARAVLSRLTTDPASDSRPLWTPDGQRIVFTSLRAGYPELYWRPADGTGSDERLLARAKDLADLRSNGWSADGRQLLVSEVQRDFRNIAIGQMAVEPPSDLKVLLSGEFRNDFAAVSPDGRWMAYSSGVSGRDEIYVERYPEMGSRQQVSSGGGRLPVWSRDGRELFFATLDGGQILAVPVRPGTTWGGDRPQVLFDAGMRTLVGGAVRLYDVGPDGRFFIIRRQEATGDAAPSNLIVVQNWFEELRRLVPVP